MKNLMFVLYWSLKMICPDAYPMVRHDNEHNEKGDDGRKKPALTCKHKAITAETHTHIYKHAHTVNKITPHPSPRYNSALTKP